MLVSNPVSGIKMSTLFTDDFETILSCHTKRNSQATRKKDYIAILSQPYSSVQLLLWNCFLPIFICKGTSQFLNFRNTS